jgi:hypothetical protein
MVPPPEPAVSPLPLNMGLPSRGVGSLKGAGRYFFLPIAEPRSYRGFHRACGRRVERIRQEVAPARDNRHDRPYEGVESSTAAFSCRESGPG